MIHSALYWHSATYVPDNAAGTRRPPHEHQLIATAGIEVMNGDEESSMARNDDDNGAELIAKAWAYASPKPAKLLKPLVIGSQKHFECVTFYGRSFGLPVLVNNALRAGVPLGRFADKNETFHTDLSDWVRELAAPSNGVNFELVLELFGLPERPDLDIAEAWESKNPKMIRRIPQRVVVDCCFIALVHVRLHYLLGTVGKEFVQNFTRVVLEAAAQKTSMVEKVFSAELGEVNMVAKKDRILVKVEDLGDEPGEDDGETTQDVVDAMGSSERQLGMGSFGDDDFE